MCSTISPATHRVAVVSGCTSGSCRTVSSGSCRCGASSGRFRQISTPAPASSTTSTPARMFWSRYVACSSLHAFAARPQRLRAHRQHHLGDGRCRVYVQLPLLVWCCAMITSKPCRFSSLSFANSTSAVPHDGRKMRSCYRQAAKSPAGQTPPRSPAQKHTRGRPRINLLALHAAVKVERQPVLIPGVAKVHRE